MFASSSSGDDDLFDATDAFVPRHLPDPGAFLSGHDVLVDREHVAVHRLAHQLFEERGVYDVTFGYNLARLNLDRRHETAGFRYAVDADDPGVLRVEFTPTTEFCPQSEGLTKGAFRAWNGLASRHEYDLVRVRVRPMHQHSDEVNAALEALEEATRARGKPPDTEAVRGGDADVQGGDDGVPDVTDGSRLSSTDDLPF